MDQLYPWKYPTEEIEKVGVRGYLYLIFFIGMQMNMER